MIDTHTQIAQFAKMLGTLGKWLEAGVAYAEKKKFDPNVLLQLRLAPDQYPLVKQVQSACDSSKLAAARLSGKEAPKHSDTEATIDELKQRVRAVVEYLGGFKASDFEGAAARKITLPWMPGKVLEGDAYLVQFAAPNVYFHVTHTYAILRHNGVDLGKADYIGELPFKDA